MAGAVNIERLLSADTESYRTVRLKHVRRFGSVRGWADAEMDEFKGVHISERQTHFKIYNKLESLKPGWGVHAISIPNYPFIKKTRMDIRVPVPCPCTMDVH